MCVCMCVCVCVCVCECLGVLDIALGTFSAGTTLMPKQSNAVRGIALARECGRARVVAQCMLTCVLIAYFIAVRLDFILHRTGWRRCIR